MESLQAGSYEEALNLFESVLKEEPTDTEAQTGLRAARDGIIDKSLISVRMARLAGNQAQAIDLLMDVLKKEKSWQFTPRAKVAFTQSEESGFAVQYIQGRIRNSIQERKPLLAESVLNTYRPLFQDPEAIRQHDTLKKGVTQSGKESCMRFQQVDRRGSPYFSDFLSQFCSHYEEECRNCASWSKQKVRELYQDLSFSGSVSELSQELSNTLTEDLRSSFQESPWFDSLGDKKAKIQLTGKYGYSHQKDLSNQVYNYTAQEPYQAIENVLKSRQVPYQDYQNEYDPGTRKYRSVPVIKYRTEHYTEPQSVVRYRSVNKSYPYSALKHQQQVGLLFSGNSTLADRNIYFSFDNSESKVNYEHSLDIPKIGLRPSVPQLMDPVSWVKANSQKAKQQFKEKLQSEWISLNCQTDASTSDPIVLADRVQKCRRARVSSAPNFVRDWYENQLGVSFETAEQLLSSH
jgi:hypothetical protein